MLIANIGRYPEREVATLVRYAFRGVPAGHVGVLVRDIAGSEGRGCAWDALPARCPFGERYGDAGIRSFVHLWLGPPEQFPADNLKTRLTRSRRIPLVREMFYDEADDWRGGDGAADYLQGLLHDGEVVRRIDRRGRFALVGVPVTGPYGGVGSPRIAYADWQEGLVAIAAHEARHVRQFARRRREWARFGAALTSRSEVDAERHAATVLAAFRSERADVLARPIRLARRPSRRVGVRLVDVFATGHDARSPFR